MEPIVASMIFYAIVIGFCEICRRLCDNFLQHSGSPRSPKMFLTEAIGALQAVTCVYENQLVTKYYGLPGFAIAVFVLLNMHRMTNRGSLLSPAALTERALIGQMALWDAVAVLVAEVTGGALAYRLATLLWRLGISDHQLVHGESFRCVLAYRMPMEYVAAYEFTAVLLMRLIIGYVSKNKPKWTPYVASLSVSLCLTAGIALVGPVALNPLIAFGRFGGCEGVSKTAHLMTYWLAPVAGWLTGWLADRYLLRSRITRLKKN